MDKTTREYATRLAIDKYPPITTDSDSTIRYFNSKRSDFIDAYLKAIEELKVKELMEENERLRERIAHVANSLRSSKMDLVALYLEEALQPKEQSK